MEQSGYMKNHRLEMICFVLLFLCKAGYHGFAYWPLLDDFIQYRVYSFYESPVTDVILRIGLLSSRPFAGIFDVFVWAKFWGKLEFAYLALAILYGIAIYLFYHILKKYTRCGFLFVVVAGLAPFLFEGTYWISAASRITVSLFCSAVGAYFLEKYISKKTLGKLFGFFFFNLLSYGFYEQTAAVSFIIILFILWENRSKTNGLVWGIPLINGMIIAIFYLFVRTGASLTAGRIHIIKSDFLAHFVNISHQIWDVFITVNGKITLYGIKDGAYLLWSQGQALYSIAIICAGILVFLSAKTNLQKNKVSKQVLWGVILFLAGLSPFFVLEGSVITLRCVVAPCLGLALLADAVTRGIFRNAPKCYGMLCALVTVAFLLGAVAETDLYYRTGAEDQKQVAMVTQTLTGIKNEDRIAVIGAPEYYDFNKIRFYEHSYSVFSSQWALSGAVRALSGNTIQAKIYPIRSNNWVHSGYEEFDKYTAFWGYGEKGLIKLSPRRNGEDISFLDQRGLVFATAQKKEEGYYLQKNV